MDRGRGRRDRRKEGRKEERQKEERERRERQKDGCEPFSRQKSSSLSHIRERERREKKGESYKEGCNGYPRPPAV